MLIAQPAHVDMSAPSSTHIATYTSRSVFAVLVPCDLDNGPGPVVAERLPLWISRETGPFAEFRPRYPDQVKFLSRQHAYLYWEDEQIFLQDLGSANGSELNGRRIEARLPVPLRDGDRLMFGCEFFSFTLKLERFSSEPTSLRVPVAEESAPLATKVRQNIPIRPATSALRVFCAKPAAGHAVSLAPAQPTVAGTTAADPAPAAADKLPLPGSAVAAPELAAAPAADPRRQRRRHAKLAVVLMLLLLSALGGTFYWHHAAQWEVEKLLAQQQYRQSLVVLKDHLARHPGDQEMTTLATRALIMAVVPEWSEKLNVLLFDAAEKLLADAQAMAPATDDARQLLALLAWISDLEQFASERGGMTTPLQLFRYEQNITGLLQRWDTAAPQHEPMMIRISHSVPAFEAIRARVSSYLRILRNDKTVHLQAIDELKQTLSRHMLEGKGATALDVLTRFAQHYPKIGGIEPLRADLTQLSVMQQAVQDHKLSSVLHLYKTEYATPLVSALAAQWSAEHLPATKDLARYQAALAAWDKGHSDIAANLLQPLTGLTWGAMATARLEHFRNITRAFGQLRAGRQQNDYGDRLLAFHQLLDPLEDRFFSAAIATDMEQYRERALNVAGSALVRAREQWAAYQDDGRISSMMRLEKPVSEAFKTQSRRLLESYRNITSAVHTHKLLKQPYSDDDRRLYDEVMSESKRQRQWLTDLGLVLDPAVLQVKLKLLPDPEGS